MELFDKLQLFRRLVDEVPFHKSPKSFESRIASHLQSFNINSYYSYIRLRNRHYVLGYLCSVDSFDVTSTYNSHHAVITVYIFTSDSGILENIYYTICYV